jgi:plastocyanin
MHDLRSTCRARYAMVLLLFLAGCGGHRQTINVTAAPGQKATVDVKAGSFYFDPDVINAHAGETLVLNVTNVTGEKHNITVKDPAGKTVGDVDIGPHQTVTMEIPLPTAGVYPFHCDIDLHATLGMKGRIEAQ